MKVLFVCTGNTCRSPMAKALLNSAVKGSDKDIAAESAGIYAADGAPASKGAIEAMKAKGIDLSGHRSKRITQELIEKNDLVLTMETRHAEMLKKAFSRFSDRIYTLRGYAEGVDADISDPYGGDANIYAACADEIESVIGKLIETGFR